MVTQGFICNGCRTQFFSAAVEFSKDCPQCKSSDVHRLVPEGPKMKWKCSHCSTELLSSVYFAGATCINCKIGRMGVDPPPDEIDDFLKELDNEMSAFEEAMGLEFGDLKNCNECGHYPCDECLEGENTNVIAGDDSLKLEPIMEECISCSNDCDGCEHEEKLADALKPESFMVGKRPSLEVLRQVDKMTKKVNNALYPWNKTPSKLKVNRGPKEYCRWCTHWTRKAEFYGYCRKHDTVRNAFLHCKDFFRSQWAKDKIMRWPG